MKMNTYVNFSGSCAEAFRYYEKHLGAKVGTMMTQGSRPTKAASNRSGRTQCCMRAFRLATLS
jgi:uncharacterized glyoxalase superfamily protein PhnB